MRIRDHWPLALILAIGAVLVLTGLNRDYLWADEGDTAVLARTILREGVPTAWDGKTFTDSDFGTRLSDDLVMVSHPWLQYYVVAGSFAAFGESAWAARLPFAVLGLLTIALVYAIVYRTTRHRWTAATAAALLTLSVQFLLYSRQSRNYTLNAALTCLLVLQFTRLRSWRSSIGFAVLGILLFHTNPIAVAPIGALAWLVTFHKPSRQYRAWFWRSVPAIALFTVPWIFVARAGYTFNTGMIQSASQFLPRLGQFLVECASVTAIPAAVLLAITVWRRRPSPAAQKRRDRAVAAPVGALSPDARALVVLLSAIVVTYGIALAITQPRDTIFTVGMRYTPAVLPFMAMTGAILIATVSRHQWRPWLALFLVIGFTKLGRLTPWTFWEQPMAKRDPSATIAFHNPERWVDRVFRTGQIGFVRSLFEPNPGTTGRVVEFLKQHASPEDIVVTNYAWEPLYFHTGLRQAMTVLPTYPIYPAAKARGLPDYVFRPEGARWIVWRRAWGPYRGQALDQLVGWLQSERIPLTLMASIPETLWENRENIHFRRFPGDRYIYPWFGQLPDTLIFRVDWPKSQP